jgi:U32 family peptidase
MPSPAHPTKPLILAPAGNRASFLAALAAGAEAIYCGLKLFSARMEAKNFTLKELAGLVDLAHEKGTQVYVTLNTLIKPDEIDLAGKMIDDLNRWVHPDALIIQDLAVIELARQTGFQGELHLSTLTNVSFCAALPLLRRLPRVGRVVLPRELNIDEIKAMALACPEGLGLEVFIHGALCYGVSGRCYWSSFLGGKSGLRGRCVQPCRRLYRQGGEQKRYFSCLDLSLENLVKVLSAIPQIRGWKIEGRKKSPHYVYYTAQAYKMLRDHYQDSDLRREAVALLERALGRRGTHYGFLSQRPQNPIQTGQQTGSGLLLGHVSGEGARLQVMLKQELLPGDVLRIGYEDEPGHKMIRVEQSFPRQARFNLPADGRGAPRKGAPVFLTDRREEDLAFKMGALEEEMKAVKEPGPGPSPFQARLPRKGPREAAIFEQTVFRQMPKGQRIPHDMGLWLSPESLQTASNPRQFWWWLTPALWPADEAALRKLIDLVLQKGGRRFVLNAPWQAAFFPDRQQCSLWAGPFCNLSNPLSLQQVKALGFSGAVVSPELGEEDYLKLPKMSPLPLGIVLSGIWPLCISRILSDDLKTERLFESPREEAAWARLIETNYWVFPNWSLNLTAFRKKLEKAGYQLFVNLGEPLNPALRLKDRPGMWNWKVGLQ